MDPEFRESEYADVNAPDFKVQPEPDFTAQPEAPLAKGDNSTLDQSKEQMKQIWERIYTFLSALPEYLGEFFGEYRRPLVTLGLIFASVVSVKMTLALLDAINDIPLLAPTFELVGLGYAAWFIYRYLWKASSRDELTKDFISFKDEVLGGKGTPKP
ncbi:MAG: CAAD domain-containing protein [Kovacikia sp.]